MKRESRPTPLWRTGRESNAPASHDAQPHPQRTEGKRSCPAADRSSQPASWLEPRRGHNRRSGRRNTGFSLLEVVLALAVLTIALTALLGLLANAARANRQAADRHALLDIAAGTLARWQASGDADAACRLDSDALALGFVCTVEARGCSEAAELRCDADPAVGALVEGIVAVARPERGAVVLRALRRAASTGDR